MLDTERGENWPEPKFSSSVYFSWKAKWHMLCPLTHQDFWIKTIRFYSRVLFLFIFVELTCVFYSFNQNLIFYFLNKQNVGEWSVIRRYWVGRKSIWLQGMWCGLYSYTFKIKKKILLSFVSLTLYQYNYQILLFLILFKGSRVIPHVLKLLRAPGKATRDSRI